LALVKLGEVAFSVGIGERDGTGRFLRRELDVFEVWFVGG
jgi:hypothetical protein